MHQKWLVRTVVSQPGKTGLVGLQANAAWPFCIEGQIAMAAPNWDESIILDDNHLQEFTGGDRDLQAQVLSIFLEHAPAYLEILCRKDNENWQADAHKLKGAARSIGAWRLAVSAEKAEALGSPAKDDPRRRRSKNELLERLEETISHIKHLLND